MCISRFNREIERKFLVPEPPDHMEGKMLERIEQGYLQTGVGVEERVRRITKGPRKYYYQTMKQGSGVQRVERETRISEIEFLELWPKTVGRRICKDRRKLKYRYRDTEGKWNQCLIEIDEFHTPKGVRYIAEVEFRSKRAAARFVAPPWFGVDVTDEPAYTNKELARRGFPPPQQEQIDC